MTRALPLFAACQPGLEPFLLAELEALDLPAEAVGGGATFDGDLEALMRACLWLGTASHVRVRLARFRCRALGELERKAAEFAWREWLTPRVPLDLHASSKRSRVYHTGAIRERVHNAIGRAFGADPLLAKDGDEVIAPLHVRFVDDTCTVSLDATSTPLHRRGYRLDGRKAPLREDLAHALVLASGFGPGGTQRLLDEVRPNDEMPQIACSDRDAGAVAAASTNAERAGVSEFLTCSEHALAAQPWLQAGGAPARGVVATNPPYGVRVAGKSPLLPLYQTLGHRVQRMGEGWRAALLAHDVRLARRTGIPVEPAFTTRHGGLTVTAMTSARADAASSDEP